MKKLLLAFATACFAISLFAQEVNFDFTANTEKLFGLAGASATDNSAGDITEPKTATIDGVSITVSPAAAGNPNPNRVWYKTPQLRMYSGTMTIRAEKNISKIVFKTTKWGANNTVNEGTLVGGSTATWTGSAKSVELTVQANTQFSGITVSLNDNNTEGGTTVTDPKDETEPETVDAALRAEPNTPVDMVGQAVAVAQKGAILSDGVNFIYYYGTPSFKIGDHVRVKTVVSKYGGFIQLDGSKAQVSITNNNPVDYPTAKNIDGAAVDAWIAAPTHEFVTVRGKLDIQGNYYNLTVEGANTGKVSLVPPTAETLGNITNGSDITVTGYAAYLGGKKYMYIVATKIVANNIANLKDPSNTLETAYTADKVKELLDDGGYDMSKEVYVKGTVVGTPNVDLTYGNANYDIQSGGQTVSVFRGIFSKGVKFDEKNQGKLKEGDEVVVFGRLIKYNEAYQVNSGNYIVTKNGKATVLNTIKAGVKNNKAYDLSGRVAGKQTKGIVILNGKKTIQ